MAINSVDILTKRLQEERENIIFTEIVGWLHDIGKLDDPVLLKTHINRVVLEMDMKKILSPNDKEKIGNDTSQMVDVPKNIKEWLVKEVYILNSNDYRGMPIITHHGSRVTKRGWIIPQTDYGEIISLVDNLDSEEDRGIRGGKESHTHLGTPFGYDFHRIQTDNLRQQRAGFYVKFARVLEKNILELRDGTNSYLKDFCKLTYADSRRPVNDISLYDHSYMVGVLSKVLLIQGIQNIDKVYGYLNERKITARILCTTFTGYDFIFNVHKLPDFIGRLRLYNEIRSALKDLIQVELPLGSVIYEDINILVFLTPEFTTDIWNELNNVIEKKVLDRIKDIVSGLLYVEPTKIVNILYSLKPSINVSDPKHKVSDLLHQALAERSPGNKLAILDQKILGSFVANLETVWQSVRADKCLLCQLLPGSKDDRGDKLCETCSSIRSLGRKYSLENTKESIWLDEIRDENNRLAILYAQIFPIEEWLKGRKEEKGYVERTTFTSPNKGKNLSASRARAILRTIEEFWDNIQKEVREICGKCTGIIVKCLNIDGKKPQIGLDCYIQLDNLEIAGYFHPDSLEIETLESLKKEQIEKFKGANKLAVVYENRTQKFEVSQFLLEDKEFYKARTISTLGNEFIIIIPANRAFQISTFLYNKFNNEFSKVLGRISLNISVVYFGYKFPLYLALDAIKRIKKNFEQLRKVRIASVQKVVEGNEYRLLTLCLEGKNVKWKIKNRFADGEEDKYYPYFETMDKQVKYINDLTEGEQVRIYTGFFDFDFLDSSTRRFNLKLQKNGRRLHSVLGRSGSRPYLLDELTQFEKLKDLFGQNKISLSQLRNIETLVSAKIDEWGLKGADLETQKIYSKFVEDSVAKILKINKEDDFEFVKNSILNGLFFDVMEIFGRIMNYE